MINLADDTLNEMGEKSYDVIIASTLISRSMIKCVKECDYIEINL